MYFTGTKSLPLILLLLKYKKYQVVCTSKNIRAELSYEFGPGRLLNLGRVVLVEFYVGPVGLSWLRAELSVILLF